MLVVNDMNGFTEAGKELIELNIKLKTCKPRDGVPARSAATEWKSEHKNPITRSQTRISQPALWRVERR
jgi:hypothetical protein